MNSQTIDELFRKANKKMNTQSNSADDAAKLLVVGTFGCGMFLAVIAMLFVVLYLLTWLAVAVAVGFGFELPFWPVFGVLLLIKWLFGGLFSISK